MILFYVFNGQGQGQNLANSESCLFWGCCKKPKSVISGNLSKNGYVWATPWTTSSELKLKFDPSLDRSWCELYKITKNHGQKNQPPGCNLEPKFPP